MSIYSAVIGARLRQDPGPSADGTAVLPRLRHALARITGMTTGCLAVLILTVVALARVGTVPSSQPLLQLLLDGRLPATANCSPRYYNHAYCRVETEGKVVALFVNLETNTIKATVDSGNDYRLGDLILAWGTPTGISPHAYGCSIVVFWGRRAAQLYTCALEAGSSVAYLAYVLDPHPMSSWRGFTTTQ